MSANWGTKKRAVISCFVGIVAKETGAASVGNWSTINWNNQTNWWSKLPPWGKREKSTFRALALCRCKCCFNFLFTFVLHFPTDATQFLSKPNPLFNRVFIVYPGDFAKTVPAADTSGWVLSVVRSVSSEVKSHSSWQWVLGLCYWLVCRRNSWVGWNM